MGIPIIALTGSPGIGKTTLIKQLLADFQKCDTFLVDGFYTQEVRENNQRIGFDLVTCNNQKTILARKSCAFDSKYKVGAYNVNIPEFEKVAIPLLNNAIEGKISILIIDEIGKMELFSKQFEVLLTQIIKSVKNIKLLTTVPLKSSHPLVTNIKANPKTTLFTITHENRNIIFPEIVSMFKGQ